MSDFPKLALGTWLMGGSKVPNPNNNDNKDISIIKQAINSGVFLIDTAQNYADGKCEEIVGKALKDISRKSYRILTKQKKDRLKYQNVIDDCNTSLKRLGVDYVDYFLCHAPNLDFDMKDFFRAANELVKLGKVKNVGVSNFGPKMLQLAIEQSDTPIVVNQVHFALDDDDVLSTGTYDFCRQHNITIQAYRTLADLEENENTLKIIDKIAQKRQLTRHQVAVAYINQYEGLAFTLRASSSNHWTEIKEALDITLKPDEMKVLRDSHKNITGKFKHFLEL